MNKQTTQGTQRGTRAAYEQPHKEERYLITAMDDLGQTATMHTNDRDEAREAIRQGQRYASAVYYERSWRDGEGTDWHGESQIWHWARGWRDCIKW